MRLSINLPPTSESVGFIAFRLSEVWPDLRVDACGRITNAHQSGRSWPADATDVCVYPAPDSDVRMRVVAEDGCVTLVCGPQTQAGVDFIRHLPLMQLLEAETDGGSTQAVCVTRP